MNIDDLDIIYDPFKDNVYSLFVEYFGDMTMTKIKDVEQFSAYYAKMQCSLINTFKYIVVFALKNNEKVMSEMKLSKLEWIYFQTRHLAENHRLKNQMYNARRFEPLMKTISITERTKNGYVYSVADLPIIITLLPKERGELDYQPSGNVVLALETFHTIVSWKR